MEFDARLQSHVVRGLSGIVRIMEEWTRDGMVLDAGHLKEADIIEQRLKMLLDLHRIKGAGRG